MMATTFLVGNFRCLDALCTERRDHSLLIWKSLPISDLTTVLSKEAIPLVLLPLHWATLPPVALAVLEMITVRCTGVFAFLDYRIHGPMGIGFQVVRVSRSVGVMPMSSQMQLTPAQFLGTLGLWAGLALATFFLAAADQLRRYRSPIERSVTTLWAKRHRFDGTPRGAGRDVSADRDRFGWRPPARHDGRCGRTETGSTSGTWPGRCASSFRLWPCRHSDTVADNS
ncbi:MAG: hypothetical protein ACP5E5_13500 [Acidobacteriaceae bacterium]